MKLFLAACLILVAIYIPKLSMSSAILISSAAFLIAWYGNNKKDCGK